MNASKRMNDMKNDDAIEMSTYAGSAGSSRYTSTTNSRKERNRSITLLSFYSDNAVVPTIAQSRKKVLRIKSQTS